MKRIIKKNIRKLRDRFLSTLIEQIELQEKTLKGLIDANLITRSMLTDNRNKPIRVILVCHTPGLWNMFDSLYRALDVDPEFSVSVVALPHRHGALSDGRYKDENVFEFMKGKGVNVIQGHNKDRNIWIDPASLNADYIFFQTPYRFYPDIWSIERVSVFSRVCYIPYGTVIEDGVIREITQPESFFRHTSLFFLETHLSSQLFKEKFSNKSWYTDKNVIVSGHPKFDYLMDNYSLNGRVWKRGLRNDIKRILWTPRWRTSEGTCHFFEYKDYFYEFCKKNQNVDFVFRPHPLCFQNFLKTGEMPLEQQNKMMNIYENSPNMFIDMDTDYADTFTTSDILITDVSSMMIEYLVTGKPIIYTHRVNSFNSLGHKISEGFYWVRNARQLEETISMLLSGNDPLKNKRKELKKEVLFMCKGGVGNFIKKHLQPDLTNNANKF